MERLFGIIKEWASVIFFAVVVALLLCALIVCAVQLSAKIGVFMSCCGLLGSGLALLIFCGELIGEIKYRRAK